MGCGTALMKMILVIFNIIFLLLGLAAVGLAIWLLVSSKELFTFLEYEPDVGTQLMKASAYVFIACGCIVVVLAIFGICGACMQNKCMLGTYSAIMIIILILEIAAIAMVVVYTNKFEDDFRDVMKNILVQKFQEGNKEFKEATDVIQEKFSCCGISGPADYANVPVVPPTSCDVFTKGCYDAFKDEFTKHKGVIIGVACGILVFEFILIVFAMCLCRSKTKNYIS